MEAYVIALNYAIPFFVGLILLEIIAARMRHSDVIRSMDTLSSLSSGLTNVIKDVLGLTFIIISYQWMVDRIALIEIESSWLVYVIAFVGLDFSGYWVHRISHKVNYFWNHHIIHHSSEEFNLGCALRQSISNFFSISFIFMVPTALLGVPGEIIAVIAPLHLFAQYWYHTRLIGRMGILEKIIVTPSHHRVHHAINEVYLDKNLSQIFIIWDKLFGTFQEELEEEPCVYGIKRAPKTWNPIIINFQHLWLLIQDAWRTHSWLDKLRIWFMPTGWRPSDTKEKYPVEVIEDVHAYQKYNPPASTGLKTWSWIQLTFTFASMMYLFNHLSKIGFQGSLIYGAFLYLSIFSYSMLMDRKHQAWIAESFKSIIGIGLIVQTGDWFFLKEVWPDAVVFVIAYYILTPAVALFFTRKEFAQKAQLQSA
ncbi:MAG: sterol desaturase family protein [Cyclobacteriaceae bacterium]